MSKPDQKLQTILRNSHRADLPSTALAVERIVFDYLIHVCESASGADKEAALEMANKIGSGLQAFRQAFASQ